MNELNKNCIISICSYCKQIIQLMNKNNSKWHEIWKILIRLSYKETLTITNTLNTFLNVIEIGLKSNKTLIAESFLCWKVIYFLYSYFY